MEEKLEKKKRQRALADRIHLRPEATQRVDGWVKAANEAIPGLRLTRGDIVTHALLSRPLHLTGQDIKALRERYFDEMAYAAWVVREMRRARERGESVSLNAMLQRLKAKKPEAQEGGEAHERS